MSAHVTPHSLLPVLTAAQSSARAIRSPARNEFDTDFFRTAGLATDQSDYVGGLYLQATTYLGFSAQQRFNEQDFSGGVQTWVMGELRSGARQVNYAEVTAEPGLADNEPRGKS